MTTAGHEENMGSTKSLLYWLNSVITIIWMFGFGLLTPIEPLTQFGMQILGIFIGLLWGWTFVGMIWPSLLGMFALSLTGYGTLAAVFKAGFGDSVTLQVLFMFLFAAYLDASGLNRSIAYWFISRKIAIGRPWVLSFLIFLSAYILSAAVGAVPVIILLWNIFYNVCKITGYTKKDRYTGLMMAGIVFTAILGVTVLPIKAFTIIVLSTFEKVSGITVDFLSFTITNLCITSVAFILWMLACKFIFKPDVSRLSNSDNDFFAEFRKQKLSTEQKIAALFLLAFVVLMMAPSIFPNTWPIIALIKQWSILGISACLVLLATFFRYHQKPLGDFTALAHGISWDVILLLAATMPICTAMESEEAGVMNFIVHLLNPLFASLSPLAFTIIFVIISALVTQVTHNLVCGIVFTPIMYRFAVELGADPILTVVLMTFVLGVAIVTPGGSAMSAMLFGNVDWIDTKSCYLYMGTAFLISLFAVLFIGLPVGLLLF